MCAIYRNSEEIDPTVILGSDSTLRDYAPKLIFENDKYPFRGEEEGPNYIAHTQQQGSDRSRRGNVSHPNNGEQALEGRQEVEPSGNGGTHRLEGTQLTDT